MNKDNQLFYQMFSFLIIGLSLVGVDLLMYLALVSVGGIETLAKFISVTTSVILSYILNARLTFKESFSKSTFYRFVIVYGISIGLNVLSFKLLWGGCGINQSIAVVIASLISAIFNFTFLKLAVFAKR
jgi:putative flippase GtrA